MPEAPDWESVLTNLSAIPVPAEGNVPDELPPEAPDWGSINEMRGQGLSKASENVPVEVELPTLPDLPVDDMA